MSESAVTTDEPNRLLALSDGVFAIAITLLVLDISVRQGLDPAEFRHALRETVDSLLAYGLSFVVIAALWRDHRRIFGKVVRADEVLVRLTLLGLGLVALMPFPTTLLADYGSQPEAVAIYAGAVAVVDAVHLGLLLYVARRPQLLSSPLSAASVRLLSADLGATILVFVVSVPLAFASPAGAKWCWVVLIPIRVVLGRLRRRRRAA
ncbi:TMEM175 family protein [Streptomyces sp. NPDC049040]|uniref:TMEM175 family protein n=1 Tax=Streptomyces sp. NPDC049040 TaxID=3365593 RepID=UPI003716976C